jgi:hypothetical protein
MQSFSDLMSSSRGPGLIGTLLALLVVVGFGSLYLFVFDQELQGSGQSIESVIRDQRAEIGGLKQRLEGGQKQLAQAPERRKTAQNLAAVTQQLQNKKAKLDGLKEYFAKVRGDLDADISRFEDYKNRYRAEVRGNAAGLKYEELKTVSGRSYRRVVIKKVDAVGMSFQHESGTGRADFDELTAEVQDYFQYDPKQKEAAKKEEAIVYRQHAEQATAAQSESAKQQQEQAARDKEALRQKNTAELASLRGLINQLDVQIENEQDSWNRERAKVRANGGIVNSAGYQSRISNLRTRRASASDRIAELQRALNS